MTGRLTEPTLRLTALHGWVTPHRHDTSRGPWTLHWATLSPADDTTQGTAACGEHLDRDREWWRASPAALSYASRDTDGLWRLCGGCLYWAGGPP